MRNLLPGMALCLLLPSTSAWAQAADAGPAPDAAGPDAAVDAGAPDGGAPDAGDPDSGVFCGAITEQGECQGSEVVYCDGVEVQRIDCATEYDPPAVCGEVDPVYGVDCLVADGEACLFIDENGDFQQAFCQGVGAACVESPDEVVCEANLGACTEADVDRCIGDRLMTDCLINQAYFIDCAEYGGSCREGACRDVPAGSFCDPSLILCDDTSACLPGLNPDFFQCMSLSAGDAGVGSDDAGLVADSGSSVPKQEEDSGCRATGTAGGGWWLAVGLMLLAFGRRRR